METFFLSLSGLALFVFVLAGERFFLNRCRRSVPLRICVTGTRGKSSVTRLIAAALREKGLRVLARTTGSRPVIIFPDGHEEEILRGSFPGILEGKKVLRLGKKWEAEAVVVEMMSIHPENLRVESRQLFKPQILVVTNIRLDHLDALGRDTENIAASFAEAVPEGAEIFLPRAEVHPAFVNRAGKRGARIHSVSGAQEKIGKRPGLIFPDNLSLGLAAAASLGVDKRTALKGMARAVPDIGELKIWKRKKKNSSKQLIFISLFAANEPESTRAGLSLLKNKGICGDTEMVGLINLRTDRGDRTLQWLDSIKKGGFPEFDRGIVIGRQAAVFKRRLGPAGQTWQAYGKAVPGDIIQTELEINKDRDTCLVGLCNIAGFGRRAVEYFETGGVPHGL